MQKVFWSYQTYAAELRKIAQQLQGSLDLTMRAVIADASRRINPITVRPRLARYKSDVAVSIGRMYLGGQLRRRSRLAGYFIASPMRPTLIEIIRTELSRRKCSMAELDAGLISPSANQGDS